MALLWYEWGFHDSLERKNGFVIAICPERDLTVSSQPANSVTLNDTWQLPFHFMLKPEIDPCRGYHHSVWVSIIVEFNFLH
jgi:hypothetical protein